ncbi:hypothetical protein ACFSQJ_19350 [Croceitalea marina]|uniref:Uncharacterized protein n=1 Tax=Croceitalea marina TaxID=1775166 RepID=A0ABW5N0P4_9FLAO
MKQITMKGIFRLAGGLLNRLGYSNEYIESHYAEWSSAEKKSHNDYIWYLFNRALNNVDGLSVEQVFEKNSHIYYAMGLFVHKYENGNRNMYTRLAFEADLLKYIEQSSNSKLQYIVEIIGSKGCDYALSLDGQKLSPEEMFDWQPLASKDCTNCQGCTCTYSMTVKRDRNGKIIYKTT